jgi:hypothetical protein
MVKQLRARTSRVVVCVDMLGEGFDLPQLKVLALHDSRKSLSPLIQLVGRFTRSSETDATLGQATVLAKLDAATALSPLRDLFREDADWNLLMRDISERLTVAAEETAAFNSSFATGVEQVPTLSLRPKLSAMAFRSQKVSWNPAAGWEHEAESGDELGPLVIGDDGNVAWFFITRVQPPDWVDESSLEVTTHELIIMRFDPDHRMLYVHGSGKRDYAKLAEQVMGEVPTDFRDDSLAFRVLDGIGYPIPTNVGVIDLLGDGTRFSLHTGPDVSQAIDSEATGTKSQTHIAIRGLEEGESASICAARSGRIWSPRTASTIHEWVRWCDHQGAKLRDSSIDPLVVQAGFVVPESLDALPSAPLVSAEWPAVAFTGYRSVPILSFKGLDRDLHDTELYVTPEADAVTTLHFGIRSNAWDVAYKAELVNRQLAIGPVGDAEISYRTKRSDDQPLSEWLTKFKPTFCFAGDAVVTDLRHILRPRNVPPFDRDRLIALDWSGVNLRMESQGPSKDTASIQHHVSQHLRQTRSFDVLLDDDGTGEVSDLVGLTVTERELVVTLVHCKFSAEDKPGARVEDLYEVCGQAVRSARWRRNLGGMLIRLSDRAAKAESVGKNPFETGSPEDLIRVCQLATQLRPRFDIIVAQPGLSKAKIRDDQLPVLASLGYHVRHVGGARLEVWTSP